MEKQKRRKKFIPWKPILIGFFTVALIAGAICFSVLFHVETITVADTFRSDADTVLNYVFPDEESRVFYRVVKKVFTKCDAPAFDSLSVRFTSPITFEICGEEKTPILSVASEETTYYFDENGYLVPEDTSEESVSILANFQVTSPVFYEQPELSEEEEGYFEAALSIASYVKAYALPSDYISVSSEGMFLVFGEVRVSLGSTSHLREKIEEVVCQYSHYEGLKGTLHMENYDGTNGGKGFSFSTNE